MVMKPLHMLADLAAEQTPVLVIGAGAMGAGIAQVAAQAGHPVFLFDAQAAALERAGDAIARDLEQASRKGRMTTDQAAQVLSRVSYITELGMAAQASLAIEAIVESLPAKQGLFAQLEAMLEPTAVIASNTSSLSITQLASGLRHPERVAGLHFFNPATRMKLVEVIAGLATDVAVTNALDALMLRWGKTPVRARSTPGFIVNRVARPFYAESLRLLGEQTTDPATLDAIVREAGGFPMGPCELMDLVGLDVNLAVTQSVFQAMGYDRRYAPHQIQHDMVWAGRLGRKTQRGFHDYHEGAAKPIPAHEADSALRAPIVAHQGGGLEGLIARAREAGMSVEASDSPLEGLQIGEAWLMVSDGRTASCLASGTGHRNVIVVDTCLDWAKTPRVVLARADSCSETAWLTVVGTLQALGLVVTRVDDVAGLVVTRLLACLINEASDVVLQGVATARDVDTAMQLGTGYPKGPLAWADAWGIEQVCTVLMNLRQHYGEERYRLSPLLARLLYRQGRFHD
jgi:3-hydroxybutyryl-CoA dehydrogenase